MHLNSKKILLNNYNATASGLPDFRTLASCSSNPVVVAVATYFLNKQAVKKQIVPRLEKIEELIEKMSE